MAQKVLIIDDEVDTRVFLQTLLKTKGFKALSAVDGVEGMEVARREKPHLIILDVMMPRKSGLNVYRELRKDPELCAVPVIMLSALSRKAVYHSQKVLDDFRNEKTPEPEAYMEKPLDPEELLAAVQKSLGKSEAC